MIVSKEGSRDDFFVFKLDWLGALSEQQVGLSCVPLEDSWKRFTGEVKKLGGTRMQVGAP